MVEASNLYVGQLFGSYCQFVSSLKAYETEHFVCFAKEDTKPIAKISFTPRNPIKPELIYYRAKFVCVKGGKFSSRATGKRNSSTLKTGCPAHIYLCCTRDGKNLEVKRLNEDHNHEVSEESFKKLPQQRRLPPDIKRTAKEMLDMRVNKKMLLQKLRRETGKMVTYKDLQNLAKQERLYQRPDEIILDRGYEGVAETYTNENDVSIAHGHVYKTDESITIEPLSEAHGHDYETEEPITIEPVSEENDDKMVFIQNKANKAVEDLVREKKRSNNLKERLLAESRKRNTYLEALLRSNDTKEQLLEESRRRNKYLETLLKLECINYNQSLKEPMQE